MLLALGEVVVHEAGDEVPRRLMAPPCTPAAPRATSARAWSASAAARTAWSGRATRRRRSAAARLASSPRVVSTMTGRRAERGVAAHELQHLEAVHVRHVEVEDHQRDRSQRQLLDRLEPAGRLARIRRRRPPAATPSPCGALSGVVDDKGPFHGSDLSIVADLGQPVARDCAILHARLMDEPARRGGSQ